MYGRRAPTITIYISGSTNVIGLDETLTHQRQMLQLIRDNISRAQVRMRLQVNTHRTDQSFNEGDWVLLRLQPYQQLSVSGRGPPKLAKRYVGPFRVLRVIGAVAYELDLSAEAQVHPVFHVSKLRPFHGTPPDHHPLFRPLSQVPACTSLHFVF